MKQLSEKTTINSLCDALALPRSGYYAWLRRDEGKRAQEDRELGAKVLELFKDSKKTYGAPRIRQGLRRQGTVVGKNRVARLMRENGLNARRKAKYRVRTTDSNHEHPISDRVYKIETAKEQFNKPNEVWLSDITYLPTSEGFSYLCVVLDGCTRKVLGWSMGDDLKTQLVESAYFKAIARTGTRPRLFHSDRGVQYASRAFRKHLKKLGIIQSMSRKGNCYDNSVMESFFHTLKCELVYRLELLQKSELKTELFKYIEGWYNKKRMHSSLDYLSPEEYEAQVNNS